MKEFVLENSFSTDDCKIDYDEQLNDQQYDVVVNGDGPCLVLAGAGSGKTRTITYRVAYLLENGVDPQNILLVTFTNKAAREMLSRVERLVGRSPDGLWGGTFHSIANRVLRRHAEAIDRTRKFTILDSEDSRSLVKLCVGDLDIDTKAKRFPSPRKLFGMISYSRNCGRSLEAVVEERYPNFFDVLPAMERVADMYTSRKRQSNAVDFDDLLILLRDLLVNNPAVRDRLASQFQYILVDEYQDTNTIQADIVKQLASVHGNVLVVGDDAQSIYSFRAAEIKNILSFPKVYPDAKTFRLTTNYRSTPEVLDLANAVINQNRQQFKKELEAVHDSHERPYLVPAANQKQEARYVVEQILELRDEGVSFPEIAVLFRAAFHSQSLEFELMKRDIPYEYRGGLKFFERAHIKDVVSHLRLLANPKDEMAWMRVLTQLKGVGTVTAGKLVKRLHTFDSVQEIVQTPIDPPSRAEEGWRKIRARFDEMQRVMDQPAEVIRAVLANGYRRYVDEEYENASERLEDLEQFAIFAESYDGLHDFLDEISLATDYGAVRDQEGSEDEDCLILSTIHQAKGLEWGAVFVISLTEGKFPNKRALNEKGGLEEERRLFYVAVTRAKSRLFLTYPTTSGYDKLSVQQPSTFVKEAPDDLLEEVRLRSGRAGRRKRQSAQNRSVWKTSREQDHQEETIVLDDLGERINKPSGDSAGGLLRDVSEL